MFNVRFESKCNRLKKCFGLKVADNFRWTLIDVLKFQLNQVLDWWFPPNQSNTVNNNNSTNNPHRRLLSNNMPESSFLFSFLCRNFFLIDDSLFLLSLAHSKRRRSRNYFRVISFNTVAFCAQRHKWILLLFVAFHNDFLISFVFFLLTIPLVSSVFLFLIC